MRSSKQRSRSKLNRNRSIGNIVNRVFDSSGPDGKVRGTPQQIIDKYNQLARDAQLSGDRVATENFQQHAEHYARLLAEATLEQEARREAQEAQHRERQLQRAAEREEQTSSQKQQDAVSAPDADGQPLPMPDLDGEVIDIAKDAGGLVDTPEGPASQGSRGQKTRRRSPSAAENRKQLAEAAQ